MFISSKLKSLIDEQKKHDSYWIEEAKMEFSLSLDRQRKASNLSYSELAKRIATSAAYITKIFRGDSNLTIESMVKLARAAGGELKIEIAPQTNEQPVIEYNTDQETGWVNVIKFPGNTQKRTIIAGVSSSVFSNHIASNSDQLGAEKAA